MSAPGDVEVSIINNTLLTLQTNNITIPETLGGIVYLNGAIINSHDTVQLITSAGTADPAIEIENTRTSETVNCNPPNCDPATTINRPAPDVRVAGDINNVRGLVSIESYGNILMTVKIDDPEDMAKVRAGEFVAQSSGDFIQGYTQGFYHVGGDPVNMYIDSTGTINNPANTNSLIEAGGQVFISAQYLNINGLVRSGFADYTIDITLADELIIHHAILSYRIGFGEKIVEIKKNKRFVVKFNVETQRIIVENINSGGGFVQLVGRIMNTNNGRIEVLDGYANVQITNNTTYDLEVRDISNLEVEGKVSITDFNYKNNGEYRTTEYSRTSSTGSRNYTYDVYANQVYRFVTGQKYIKETTDLYIKKSALGIDWLAKDDDPPATSDVVWLDKQPLVSGTYYRKVSTAMTVAHTYTSRTYQTNIEPPKQVLDDDGNNIWDDDKGYLVSSSTKSKCTSSFWGICLSREYKTTLVYNKGQIKIVTHNVNAGYDIAIKFIGSNQGNVEITSTQSSVIVTGRINNPSGTTTITSKKINASDDAMVGGQNVILNATHGIGKVYSGDIAPIHVETGPGGSVKATTNSGDVVLSQWLSDMVISSVGSNNGNVNLFTYNDIISQDASALVYGKNITLEAQNIGVDSSNPLLINGFYPKANSGITVKASNDIYIEETQGNMNIYSIEANNVWLKTIDGNFIDAMLNEEVDQRSIDELEALWANLNLLDTPETRAKTDQTVLAYQNGRTSEYHSYWETRNKQADPSVYNPNFQVTLTEEEKDNYRTQLNWDDAAIAQYELKLTSQYHALHEVYGVVGDTYDNTWEYQTSTVFEPDFTSDKVDLSNNIINVGEHIYKTGQRVVYECNGNAAIGGLECGETYYVVVVDSTHIQLTTAQADAIAETPTNLIEFTTTGIGDQWFSESDAIRVGSIWSEYQLRYALLGGWLKETSDTTTAIEQENIIANGNITLIAQNGGVGSNNGIIEIDVTGGAASLTQEDRINLAASERNDATIINGQTDSIVFGEYHGLQTGDEIVFPSVWGIKNIDGVLNNKTYYVIAKDGFSIQLTNSLSDAQNGTGIVDILEKTIVIEMREDIDLTVEFGNLQVESDRHVYIGSEEDLRIKDIDAGLNSSNEEEQLVRVKVGKKLIWDGTAGDSISGGDMILESGTEGIGAADSYMVIDLMENGALTARANQNIYIQEITGAYDYGMAIDTIYSPNDVYLKGVDIYDAFDPTSAGLSNIELVNIKANQVTLETTGKIGQTDSNPYDPTLSPEHYFLSNYYLEIVSPNGVVINSAGDINLAAIGNLLIDTVNGSGAYINLMATNAILDARDDILSNVNALANNTKVFLYTKNGTVGENGNDLDIATQHNANSHLTIESADSVYLSETLGDLYLNVITAYTGIAFIFSPNSIYNAEENTYNVVAGKTRLFAGDGIGTSITPLRSMVSTLQGSAGNADVYIENTGDLTIEVVDGNSPYGFTGKGKTTIGASSPIDIKSNVKNDGDLSFYANDSTPADYDNFTLYSGVSIEVTNGNLLICAGDNIYLNENTTITVPDGTVTINVNCQNVDSENSLIQLSGAISAQNISIVGSATQDTFNINPNATFSEVTFDLSDDADIFNWNNIIDDLNVTINAGSGNDQIHLINVGLNNIFTINGDDDDDLFDIIVAEPTTKLILNGNAGNDTFKFADNQEYWAIIDGGDGTSNTIDYSDWTVPVIVTFDKLGSITGYSGTITGISERYDNINDVIGSTAYFIFQSGDMDTIFRLLDENTFEFEMGGRTGTLYNFNELRAGAGNDLFEMYNPNTYIMHTNAGEDTLSYHPYTTDVVLDMINQTYTDLNGSIDGIENLQGGAGNDILIGNHGNNKLRGDLGDDQLIGNRGNDTYQIDENAGADVITEKANQGTDRIDYSIHTVAVDLELTPTEIKDLLSGAVVDYTGQSIEELNLTAYDDKLLFSTGNSKLQVTAGAGDDTFYIADDNITSLGTVYGEQGTDHLNTQLLPFDIIEKALSTSATGFYISLEKLKFFGIDILDFNSAANNTFVTNLANGVFTLAGILDSDRYQLNGQTLLFNYANILIGSTGHDTFNIEGTIDYDLYGNSGDDSFTVTDSAKLTGILDAGRGYDTLSFNALTSAIEIAMQSAGTYDGFQALDNLSIFTQAFNNINLLIGTTFNDTLIGIQDAENTFNLTAPDQGWVKAVGRSMNFISFENLFGGNENDTFIIDDGASISGDISGRDGSDTISYQNRRTPVEVNLLLGLIPDVGGNLTSIENVTGGIADDIITGDNNDNVLKGGAGNDLLIGLDGDDDFWIGTGYDDRVIGGNGYDTTYYHWENTSPISNLDCERIIYLQPPFVWERYNFNEGSYLDYKVVADANTAPIEDLVMITILHTYSNGFKFQKQVLIQQWHMLGYEMTVFAGSMIINFFIPEILNGYHLAVYYWDETEQTWIEIESLRYQQEDGTSIVTALVLKPGYYTVTIAGQPLEDPLITKAIYQ